MLLKYLFTVDLSTVTTLLMAVSSISITTGFLRIYQFKRNDPVQESTSTDRTSHEQFRKLNTSSFPFWPTYRHNFIYLGLLGTLFAFIIAFSQAQKEVALLNNPALENRHEDELALRVHPVEEKNGWIEGMYPRFKVENGDRFLAWVGCLEGNQNCSLTFLLEYQDANGAVHTLGEWTEVYDGKVHQIDLNLSSLAGQTVRFILRTEVNNSSYSAAEGFWFVPRIERPAATSQLQPERTPVQ